MKTRSVRNIVRFTVKETGCLHPLRVHWIQEGCRIEGPRPLSFLAIHLDTPDQWYQRAGLVLRLFISNRKPVLVLESNYFISGHPVRQIEIRDSLTDPPPPFPGPLPAGRISRWIGRIHPAGRNVEIFGRFAWDRETLDLFLPSGSRIRICANTFRPDAGPSRRRLEVELEQIAGDSSELERISRSLEDRPGWIRIPMAVADLSHGGHPVPTATSRPGHKPRSPGCPFRPEALTETLGQAIQAQWMRVRREEPGARAGLDPERIHQMRLAVRRLRSLLYLCPSTDPTGRILLSQLGRILGRIRDRDIGIGLLTRFDGLPSTATASSLFRDSVSRSRDASHRTLLRFLDSTTFRKRLAALNQPKTRNAHSIQRDLAGYAGIPRRFARQIRTVQKAICQARSDASRDAIHRVRILGKKTRYILEALSPLLGTNARSALLSLSRLQQQIGEFQDEATFLDTLKDCRRRILSRTKPISRVTRKSMNALLTAQKTRILRKCRNLEPLLRDTGLLERELSSIRLRCLSQRFAKDRS